MFLLLKKKLTFCVFLMQLNLFKTTCRTITLCARYAHSFRYILQPTLKLEWCVKAKSNTCRQDFLCCDGDHTTSPVLFWCPLKGRRDHRRGYGSWSPACSFSWKISNFEKRTNENSWQVAYIRSRQVSSTMTTTGVQFPKLALMESDKMQENIRKNVVAAKEFTHLFHPRIGNFSELPVTRSVSDTTMRKYLFSVLCCLTCENSCDM